MRKETGLLIAAGLGVLALISFFGMRRFMTGATDDYDDEYYSDFHRHFEKRYRTEEHHGIEYLSVN